MRLCSPWCLLSAGEQRLSDLYRKKALQALIEELKKFCGLRTG
jgi:hypothetical protein